MKGSFANIATPTDMHLSAKMNAVPTMRPTSNATTLNRFIFHIISPESPFQKICPDDGSSSPPGSTHPGTNYPCSAALKQPLHSSSETMAR
ncbi:hypothetical protein TNIN_306021 [Trichonephila inaurata madagascariensis]|uniref:Uncharacterized protein n=1 Tax=Trichonephila inaurata madagascariensis TaxID=2747483 RepID=A0A8X7CQW4_9ARAC|nr:hypothetical protein TNIN_306021 [Trichonephila inaurata madagascariensis]